MLLIPVLDLPSYISQEQISNLVASYHFMVTSVMEASGAMLLGCEVTGTIKSKIVNVAYYCSTTMQMNLTLLSSSLLGTLTALLVGGSICLITATYYLLQMPVSIVHTIVVSIAGFTIAAHGTDTVNCCH